MKVTTESEYIYRLIAEGEHQTQDFKFEISDACKIARSISAFANTDGGRLLVGVKDNGKIAGVRSEEEIYMIEAASEVYCEPHVECAMQTYRVEGKSVLVVTIEPQRQRPIYARDEKGKRWAYVRIADENIFATPVHLKLWQQKGEQTGSLMCYTEREQRLLNLLAEEEPISLNRYCRKAHINRREAQELLALFIRYDIVEMVFQNHHFYFRLKSVS